MKKKPSKPSKPSKLLNTSAVIKALEDGSFDTWDKETQQEALKLRQEHGNVHSDHILELIVIHGLVSKIPHELLDQESILIRDEYGEPWSGLLHLCVNDNQWKKLPKYLFTEDNLLVQNFWGNTPIQEAAMAGCYEMIMDNLDLLTEKTFKDVNKDNDTTLELLIANETCRFNDRGVPKNIKDVLPKILKKFRPNSLVKYYRERIQKNHNIKNEIKNIFRLHIFKPKLKKTCKEEEITV